MILQPRRARRRPHFRWRGHHPQILVKGHPNPQEVMMELYRAGKLPQRHPRASEPLTHAQLLMLYRRLGENNDNAYVQLRRLNEYMGRRWMLGVERVANNSKKKWICFRGCDGAPRSPGGRFFAVVMNLLFRERKREILSLPGYEYLMLKRAFRSKDAAKPRMNYVPCVARKPPVLKKKTAPTDAAPAEAAPASTPEVPKEKKPRKSPFRQAKGKRGNIQVEVIAARRPAQ